ncbi:MAG: ribulose-phosphate 3-epimerase [Lachnospiraceae bacterium]|nr:ribulose-phosphate 3-epimerase [Lachnospiraceae bacterium]
MYQLSPSILSADFACLGDQIRQIEAAGADLIHIDVMDGCFVPRISYGMPVIQSIRKVTKLPFDVHCMVEEPFRFVYDLKACGADMMTIHYESCKHLHTTLLEIKRAGMKAGVAINPATPPEVLRYVLPEVDMVLVMTVNPGYGGQKFLPAMIEKIREVKTLTKELGVNPMIQVDGGITLDNLEEVIRAGADVIVAGTSIFSGDIAQNVARFKEVFAHVHP